MFGFGKKQTKNREKYEKIKNKIGEKVSLISRNEELVRKLNNYLELDPHVFFGIIQKKLTDSESLSEFKRGLDEILKNKQIYRKDNVEENIKNVNNIIYDSIELNKYIQINKKAYESAVNTIYTRINNKIKPKTDKVNAIMNTITSRFGPLTGETNVKKREEHIRKIKKYIKKMNNTITELTNEHFWKKTKETIKNIDYKNEKIMLEKMRINLRIVQGRVKDLIDHIAFFEDPLYEYAWKNEVKDKILFLEKEREFLIKEYKMYKKIIESI